ncbi:MAG: GTP pyrophosphokinase [Draconibacterium sp.]|nr:MAG: GTP pyrophosphokinase [Draconibacterium sp.]
MQRFTPAEIRYIEDSYQDFLKEVRNKFDEGRIERIEKAFRFANAAHDGMRRKSGEPFIIHPIAVAKIVARELGLGATSIVAAILHDVVEDTEYRLSDIENMFGEKVARIVDGLTKLSSESDTRQALTLKKMLMTLSDDVRVILIKIADRLHNMQTLDSMPVNKKAKIAGETLFLYVPLAHRLGLYNIKTELEELSFKYKHPEEYNQINYLLHNQEEKRNYLVNKFIAPIKERMKAEHFDCQVTHRLKSSYSIWQKMQKKGVAFNEIYDILAVRIIIKPNPAISEKRQCFDALSIITDIYRPKPDRIRDWINLPKVNGYESLHVTVMGPQGKWVEVQIRTERMDEIANRGFAAHYRYKDISTYENELETWIERIRDHLNSPNSDAFEFLDDFKLSLNGSDINVFTPKGDMVSMPQNSTVIDFAYHIHTDLGNKCIGAKINLKLVPINHVLQSGDQIEILTSENQLPKLEWLKFTTTAKARAKIKDVFKTERNKHISEGKKKIEKAIVNAGAPLTMNNLKKIIAHYNLNNKDQLYSEAGMGFINLDDVSHILGKKSENKLVKYWNITFGNKKKAAQQKLKNQEGDNSKQKKIDKKKTFLLREAEDEVKYSLARCCNPIPGDHVMGYLITDEHVNIHKADCPILAKYLANQGEKIVTAAWARFKKHSFLTRLQLEGFDRTGILSQVANIISNEHNINMRSVQFDTNEGIFKGDLFLYIHNTEDLNNLISQLKKIKGIDNVSRIKDLYD